MAQITYFVALPFHLTDDGEIVAGEPQECQSNGGASRAASSMAADPKNCGAIAFSRSGDPALGDFANAVVIASVGEVDTALIAGS